MSQPETIPTQEKLRVLNLEDNASDSELIRAELEAEWKEVELLRIETREAFVEALEEFKPDIVLCDFWLPDFDGNAALTIVRQTHPEIPVIMVTGVLSDSAAVKLIKMGARDYVTKDRLQRLASAVQGALSMEQGIRARKAAEKVLRQSEADFRTLVEHSPIATLVDVGVEADEKIVMMNRKFTELFGYTMEDVPDIQHWWPLAYPDKKYREEVRAEWIRRVEKAIQNHGDIEPMEATVTCKDGSSRYIRGSLASIGNRNIIAFEDLTERKQVEEELERFFNLIPDPVCIAMADGHFLKVNPAWQELLGYTIQEILAMPFLDLIHPDDRVATIREVERQLAGEDTVQFTNRYRCRDGGYRWLEWRASPAVGKKLLFASARDITERKQSEESLRKLSLAVEQSPNSIVVTNLDAKLEYVNEAFIRVSGYSRAEAIGQNPRILQSGKTPRETYTDMWSHLKRGETWKGEFINRRKDGREYIESTFASPVRDADGRITHYIAIKEDITERKQLEKQLAAQYEQAANTNARLVEANEKLQRTNMELKSAQRQLLQSEKMASIGLLAAGVAHEINNPVGYINSNLGSLEKYVADILTIVNKYEETALTCTHPELQKVQVLKEKLDFNFLRDDIQSLLAESREGLERIKEIVLGLKDFSRSSADETWHWADLNKCMENTLAIVRNELKYKCDIVKEYGALPQVYCLPSQLEQVFMNLLVNAAQAIETRGTITIRTGQEGDRVWIEIADTGVGIPPEIMPHIFDPFFTTKPVGTGTGLGLPVSYGIIERHHGKIEVQSEAGKGSTFRVILPVQPDNHKEET